MKLKQIYQLLAALLLCSCNSFLEPQPDAVQRPDDIYRDPQSCMAGLAGVYDPLGAIGCYGQNLWGDLDAGTDLLVYNRAYGKDYIQISNYNYNSTDNALATSWNALYNGVNRANDFISMISERSDSECGGAAQRRYMLGEAHALRAIYYMNLVAFWGEVPLRLEPTRSLTSFHLAKSPQPAIYAQIVSDLTFAAENCQPATELTTPGRISATAARALLARAYMWQAGYPVEADTWGNALAEARKVRDSHIHGLLPREKGGYRQVFINMCSNLYDLVSRESMLEVEFYGNGLTSTNEAGRLGLFIGVTQQTASTDHPYAYGFYDATKILFRLYEDGDERQWWNVTDYKYTTDTSGKVHETPRTTAERNTEDGNAAKWRAKYIPERPLSRNNSSINFPIMRYADVLLMIAECANEVSGAPTPEAVEAINSVRLRAGASAVNISDYDYESFRQLVRDERARELCFETPRRMELRRAGADYFRSRLSLLSDQSLNSANKTVGYDVASVKAVPAVNFAPKHIYFPIPQTELNTNTACKQTSGW